MLSMKMKSFFCASICATFLVGFQVHSAAIPMWELLSKDEKVSYLYSMFANQVEDFCESISMRNCNHELLKFGLGKLKDMPEDHLDTMDPYQRGGHDLIWDSMMQGHEMVDRRPKLKPVTSTYKPNSYNDQSFSQDYQGQASAKIETVYRVPAPQGFYARNPQYTVSSGPSQYRLPGAYNGLQRGQEKQYSHAPLTGPMVVKVHLDGTPVHEQPDLPHDEDLRQYHMSKVTLPNL